MADSRMREKEEIRGAVADYENWMRELAQRRDILLRERMELRKNDEEGQPEESRQLAAAQARIEARMRRISRLRACYMTLPRMQYAVITKLYKERCPWKAVVTELGVSKRTILRERSAALSAMREAAGEDGT